jgi:hypothetical protein
MCDQTTSRDDSRTDSDTIELQQTPQCCDSPNWQPVPENRFELPGPEPRQQYYSCSNCGAEE